MLKFHALTVSDVQSQSEDAVVVTLEVPSELRAQFRYRGGQHIVVRAQVEAIETRRTYSLLSGAGELPLRIGLRIHAQGRLSRYLGEQLRAGEQLEVMPPNGSFGADLSSPGGGTYVAFAAGCGITPVLSIASTLLAADDRCRLLVFYGNRGLARAMLTEELLALKDRYLERLALHFLMSREPQEIELLNGRLDAAKVTELAGRLWNPLAVREYFVCGPGTMIEDVRTALAGLGVEAARIHAEHFAVQSTGEKSLADAASVRTTGEVQVAVNMDGRRRIFVMQASETILEAAERAGLDLPFSCKAGVCSTCRTKLVAGEVELAANYALEDWELAQGYILACQARPKTAELEINYDAS